VMALIQTDTGVPGMGYRNLAGFIECTS